MAKSVKGHKKFKIVLCIIIPVIIFGLLFLFTERRIYLEDLYGPPEVKALMFFFYEYSMIDEMDFISQSIARQLIPTLTNSMPITISVNVQPENIVNSVKMYIDETLVQNFSVPINLDSGVHYIQFSAENYKTAGTTYYFQGNTNYKIDVVLENAIKGEMYITNSEEYKEENFASKITNFIFFIPNFIYYYIKQNFT